MTKLDPEVAREIQARVDQEVDAFREKERGKARRVSQRRHIYDDPPDRLVKAELCPVAWKVYTRQQMGTLNAVIDPVLHMRAVVLDGRQGYTVCGRKIGSLWASAVHDYPPREFRGCSDCRERLDKIMAPAQEKPERVKACIYCGQPARWIYYYMQPSSVLGQSQVLVPSSGDNEIDAMNMIKTIMSGFDDTIRARILAWVNEW